MTHAPQTEVPSCSTAWRSNEAWARALAALAVLLILSLAPGVAGADATVTIGSATVAPGASVDLPVTITTSRGLSFLRFDVVLSAALCGVLRDRGSDGSITGVVVGADESVAVGKDLFVRKTSSVSQNPQEEVFPCSSAGGGHVPIAVFDLTGGTVIAAGTAPIFRIQFDVKAGVPEGSFPLTASNAQAKDGPITVLVVGQAGTLTIDPILLCGNGTLDPGEQCDDGNRESGDGCSEICEIEPRLDAFFCYETRRTKGMFCSAEAGDRAGDPCEDEEDCGGVTGEEDTDGTGFCLANAFVKGRRVAVADRLEAGVRIFDVKKPVNLCAPAATNGDGVSDAATHLEGFQLTLTKGKCAAGAPMHAGLGCTKEADCGGDKRTTKFCVTQAKAVPRTDIPVVDPFHPAGAPLRVDAVKPDRLLVPTAKGLTEPVALPGPNNVDQYKCYTTKVTKGAPKFTPIPIVAVDDQFTAGAWLFSLTKPTRLCTPADTDGEGIKDASTGLMCYKAVAVKGVCGAEAPTNKGGVCGREQDCGGTRQTHFCQQQAKFQRVEGLFVNNRFGPSQLDTTHEEELCVPATTPGLGP